MLAGGTVQSGQPHSPAAALCNFAQHTTGSDITQSVASLPHLFRGVGAFKAKFVYSLSEALSRIVVFAQRVRSR